MARAVNLPEHSILGPSAELRLDRVDGVVADVDTITEIAAPEIADSEHVAGEDLVDRDRVPPGRTTVGDRDHVRSIPDGALPARPRGQRRIDPFSDGTLLAYAPAMRFGAITPALSSTMAAALFVAGCQPAPSPIASLSNTRLDVIFGRSAAGDRVAISLQYEGVGEKLGDGCPIVTSQASIEGRLIPQLVAGGPSACGFLGGEVDCAPDVCQPVVWEADLLAGLSFPDDGTVTIEIADAGGTTRVAAASAANLWADAVVGNAVPSPYHAHQATLALTPPSPFDAVVLPAATPPNPHTIVLDTVAFRSATVTWSQLFVTGNGPDTFTVTLPDDATLPHPVAATLIPSLVFEPPLSACEGVGSCTFAASAVLPAAALTIP